MTTSGFVEGAKHLIEIRNIGKDYQSGETKVQAITNMDFFIDGFRMI